RSAGGNCSHRTIWLATRMLGADQHPVLPPLHADSGRRRVDRFAIEKVPGTRQGFLSQDESPPVLLGSNIVDDPLPGSRTREGNEVGTDWQVLDADVLPAGRKMRLEHDRPLSCVGPDAEDMFDQW